MGYTLEITKLQNARNVKEALLAIHYDLDFVIPPHLSYEISRMRLMDYNIGEKPVINEKGLDYLGQ